MTNARMRLDRAVAGMVGLACLQACSLAAPPASGVVYGSSTALVSVGTASVGGPAGASLIANNAGGVVANNSGALVSNNAGGLVSNNAGGLRGALTGPSAALIGNNASGLIANNAGGLVSNNAGGLVSNNAGGLVSNNAGGLVSNNAGGYLLLAEAEFVAPLAGVSVEVTDEQGAPLAPPVLTNADGTFEIPALKPSGPAVYVHAAYSSGGQPVTMAAAVDAPRAPGLQRVDVNPASTLVNKKVGDLIRTGKVAAGRVKPSTIATVSKRFGEVMTAKSVVAAVVLPENSAAQIYDRMLEASPPLKNAVQESTGAADDPVLVTAKSAPAAEVQAPPARVVAVITLAGAGTSGSQDGPGASAQFRGPSAVARDAAGNLFVVENGANRIRKIDATGTVSTVAGIADAGPAALNRPTGLAVGADGSLFIADTGNHRVCKLDPAGVLSTVAGVGKAGFADGAAAAARFNSPTGLALDAGGTLYVSDSGNNRIRKIAPDGTVTTLAGGDAGYADGSAADARFNNPEALALDGKGKLFVADRQNFRIRAIELSSGTTTTLAGGSEPGAVDGASNAAKFAAPTGIATDGAGNVYVSDTGSQRILVVAPSGYVSTLAGTGKDGRSDGAGTSATFNGPMYLAADANGVLYVPDYFNQAIRQVK